MSFLSKVIIIIYCIFIIKILKNFNQIKRKLKKYFSEKMNRYLVLSCDRTVKILTESDKITIE